MEKQYKFPGGLILNYIQHRDTANYLITIESELSGSLLELFTENQMKSCALWWDVFHSDFI